MLNTPINDVDGVEFFFFAAAGARGDQLWEPLKIEWFTALTIEALACSFIIHRYIFDFGDQALPLTQHITFSTT